MIATAAGTTAPTAVSTAVTTNMIHGMNTTRPRTDWTAACTSQSMVPLFFAIAKRNVTPARMTKRSPGKPPASSSTFSSKAPSSTNIPTTNAAAMARAPMWMGSRVAIRKIRQRTRIETTSADMRDLPVHARAGCEGLSQFRMTEV